jgi:hypothetical protein
MVFMVCWFKHASFLSGNKNVRSEEIITAENGLEAVGPISMQSVIYHNSCDQIGRSDVL